MQMQIRYLRGSHLTITGPDTPVTTTPDSHRLQRKLLDKDNHNSILLHIERGYIRDQCGLGSVGYTICPVLQGLVGDGCALDSAFFIHANEDSASSGICEGTGGLDRLLAEALLELEGLGLAPLDEYG